MTGVAVLFLVISIVVVWGGLAASILYLRAHPTPDGPEDDDTGVLGQAGGGDGPAALR